MNLDEIKKRAEDIKAGSYEWQFGRDWAADTILPLVAEIERLDKECKGHVDVITRRAKAADVLLDNNKKLTAANKIMREALEKVDRGPEFTKAESVLLTTKDCLEKVATFSQVTAHEALNKLKVD